MTESGRRAVVWVRRGASPEDAAGLAAAVGVTLQLAQVLLGRGIASAEAAAAFLHPSLDQLHDPLSMLGMPAAVERLRRAIGDREPMLIYGDYDVDGTVATVLLKAAIGRAAAALGTTADVRYHIPHRVREGYGMQDGRIAEAADEGVRLVISVDTGIRAYSAADEAGRLGLDLIVTDHHLPDGARGVPDAVAVVNPNQLGCGYPCKDLCGAGVAFKLAQALLESVTAECDRARLLEKTLPSFLKLLAVATIGDSVPLTGENRAIVALGLRELRNPVQPGLKTLMALAQIDTGREIAAEDIGFRLAPRINAAGRMDIASDVVELFLARDADRARSLAEKLHRLNDDRRAAEAEALRDLDLQLDGLLGEGGEEGLPACLVLDDGDGDAAWHRGVIGILASRVVDRTGVPTLVVTHEDGVAHGSGRSVADFHLLDALTAANGGGDSPLLTRFGGHAHAVGFALPSGDVPTLRARMARYAAGDAARPQGTAETEYDAEIALSEITDTFWATLQRLGPHGVGNPAPVFLLRGVQLDKDPRSVKERHLRLSFSDGRCGRRLGGMAWGRRTNWVLVAQREGWKLGSTMDAVFRLRENRHSEFGGLEMEILTLRLAGAQGAAADEADEATGTA